MRGPSLSPPKNPNLMNPHPLAAPEIREHVLRDPSYPVHKIADQLLPYLRVLVDRFHPEQVILFGSYAYGEPTLDSDVDLLVLKKYHGSSVAEATRMRRAVRPLRHSVANLPLDLMVRESRPFHEQVEKGAFFHSEITRKGVRLV